MQTTTNLGLKKPESNEYVNVNDINDNSDTLDEAVAARVDSSGGDISETVIETLEPIDTKYPVPVAGESTKVFMGKVKKYIEDTKPLDADMLVYVATTGSNTSGDGTSSKPYKTIQYAINDLPKDLGGYSVSINVASGTYDETINVIGLYNGAFNLYSDTKGTLNDTCKIKNIIMHYNNSYVYINGFTLTDATVPVGIEIWASKWVNLSYCQSTITATTKLGIYYGESGGAVDNCKFSQKNAVLQATNSKVSSANWNSGSTGNIEGLQSVGSAIITKVGTQPTAIHMEATYNGGMFINNNGTQISESILSGLSCTWGFLSGGYVRHGNLNGPAMVTLHMSVSGSSSSLSSNTEYLIQGFPKPYHNVPVCFGPQAFANNCFLDTNGIIHLWLTTNVPLPFGFLLNCTYRTNF